MSRKASLISSLLLGTVLALHDSPAFSERILTLEEAYRLADRQNEQVQTAREDLLQAESETRRARSFILPKVSADYNYLRRPDPLFSPFGVLRPESEDEFSVLLEQPLYSGGRAMATYRIAKKGREGQKLNLNLTRETLLFNVARAYYEALKAQKNVAIEESEVKRLEEHRNNADKRVRVGEATRTVLLRAEAELSGAKARLIRAQNNLATGKDQLALLVRIEGPYDLAEPSSGAFSEKTDEEWIRTANENRFDLQSRAIETEIAREQVKFARGAFLPSLSLEARYDWVDQDPKSSFLIQNDRTAMLKLNIPIFEGGRRVAELSQAKSRFRQSEMTRNFLKDQVDLEVRRALLNLSALTSELNQLKDQVAFARDNFSLVSRQFAVGLSTHIDVLDANATLLDAERQFSNTTYDRAVASLDLERTAGVFLELIRPNEGREP